MSKYIKDIVYTNSYETLEHRLENKYEAYEDANQKVDRYKNAIAKMENEMQELKSFLGDEYLKDKLNE